MGELVRVCLSWMSALLSISIWAIVIKTNAKQRYATDSVSSFIVKKLVEAKGGRVQEFEVRNDWYAFPFFHPILTFRLTTYVLSPCGSTVGPMLSKSGIRTVDVGNPMLAMHSIRETAGSHDVQTCIDLFESLFEGFAELDRGIDVE